jgi:hypothetical protein
MRASPEHLGPKQIPAAARKLAAEAIAIAIDCHIDTVQRVLGMGEDLGKRGDVGHVDVPRLREGGMHAPFFASVGSRLFFRRGSGAQAAGSAGCDAIGAG